MAVSALSKNAKNRSHQRFWLVIVSAALFFAGFGMPVVACSIVPLADLPASGTFTTARPVIRWHAPAQSGPPYRVMLEAREPEGRVLHAEDVLTANTELIPAQALAQTRASVKVLVSVGCAELTPRDLAAQAAAFHIDARGGCRGAASLMFDAATRRLTWESGGQSSATQHELRVFDSTGARLLESTVLAAPQWTAGAHIELGALAAVRAQCGGVFGPFSFATLR